MAQDGSYKYAVMLFKAEVIWNLDSWRICLQVHSHGCWQVLTSLLYGPICGAVHKMVDGFPHMNDPKERKNDASFFCYLDSYVSHKPICSWRVLHKGMEYREEGIIEGYPGVWLPYPPNFFYGKKYII